MWNKLLVRRQSFETLGQTNLLRSIWGRRESERICSHWSSRCYKLATHSSRASNSRFTFFLLTELEEFNPLTALGSGHLSGDNKSPAMILRRTHFKNWLLFCCRQLARCPGIFCNPVSIQGPHNQLDRCDPPASYGFFWIQWESWLVGTQTGACSRAL